MKKNNMNLFFAGMVVATFLTAQMNLLSATGDTSLIKKYMGQLGFGIQKITPLKDGFYQAQVNRFSSKGGLILKGLFKPFLIGVKVRDGKLLLQKSVLQKKQFKIYHNRLPKMVMIQDFKFPPMTPHTLVSAGDPVIRTMTLHLSSVKKYQRDTASIVCRIREQARRADNVLDGCSEPPPPDPRYVSSSAEPSMPIVGTRFRPMDSSYLGFPSCNNYPKNVQTASRNARSRFEGVERILAAVNRIKEWVDDRCGDGCCIKEADKISLKNTLLSLLRHAESAEERFGLYISDIERFIQEYKECERNQTSTMPTRHRNH